MKNIYFISGHRDLYPRDFEIYYADRIREAWKDIDSEFILGDYKGVDAFAQDLLYKLVLKSEDIEASKRRVTIFHMGNFPMNNIGSFKTLGNFTSDIERDNAMTEISTEDIAYVGEGRWTSGTAQNILRRFEIPVPSRNVHQEVMRTNEINEWLGILYSVLGTVSSSITTMLVWNLVIVSHLGIGKECWNAIPFFMIIYFFSLIHDILLGTTNDSNKKAVFERLHYHLRYSIFTGIFILLTYLCSL